MSQEAEEPSGDNLDRVLFGGLSAACVGVLTQLSDKTASLGTFLGWGVLCFALALPLLVGSLLIRLKALTPGRRPRWYFFFDFTGVAAAVGGFAMLFFNMNLVAGGVFVATLFVAVVVFGASQG
jgi:hypothetical protein